MQNHGRIWYFPKLVFGVICLLAAVPARAQLSLNSALFSAIDQRGIYGHSTYPEPLLAPEMDVEAELRFDWLHQEKSGRLSDKVKGEFEYSFGYLTVEVGSSYSRDQVVTRDAATGRASRRTEQGIGSTELAARYPLYQYLSRDAAFEYNLVGAVEVAVPSGSKISRDTEVVPAVYQLMRFGDHFTVQTSIGLSTLTGPDQGGVNMLEYSTVVGYMIERDQLRLPGVLRTIPMVELVGDRTLNGIDRGNRLSTTLGARILFDSLGKVQPRLGLGVVLPVNHLAREDSRWGFITSLVFEF
jgi:hypothetical protein